MMRLATAARATQLASLFVLLAGGVASAEITQPAAYAPVREIMRLQAWRVISWPPVEHPFSPDALRRLYTKSFARDYREARRLVVEAEDPFATDPIGGGQDSCPLDKVELSAANDGAKDSAEEKTVLVSFNNRQCMSGTEEQRAAKTLTYFHVKRENGAWRVDDIVLEDKSLKQELAAAIKRHRKR